MMEYMELMCIYFGFLFISFFSVGLHTVSFIIKSAGENLSATNQIKNDGEREETQPEKKNENESIYEYKEILVCTWKKRQQRKTSFYSWIWILCEICGTKLEIGN